MAQFFKDLRYSFRLLTKNAGFTMIAVLTLGIGVGVNSAIYSVTDALLLRPLMLPDLERIVAVGSKMPDSEDMDQISVPDFLDFRAGARTLDHLSAYGRWRRNLTGAGAEPVMIETARATPSFFDTLGVKPVLGRAFLPEEEQPGRDRVAILSHRFWERSFGADQDVLRRTVELNGERYEVVGVMPDELRLPPEAEVWTPLAFTNAQREQRGAFYLDTVARLKPGFTIEQAQAEMGSIARRASAAYPLTHSRRSADVRLLRKVISGENTGRYMVMLMVAVGFLLLLACTNVANLIYARVSARARDLAIRAALGASRARLVTQLLTESAVLGLLGATTGLLFAVWGMDLIRSSMPAEVEVFLPGWQRIGVNPRIVLFTTAVAVLSGLAAGLVSAWASSRTHLQEILKDSGRGTTSGVHRHRVRATLVVTQMILAIVLLAGAGLMVRSFRTLSEPVPGMQPERLFTMRVSLPDTRYKEPERIAAFETRLLSQIQTIPGVETAAFASDIPYSNSSTSFATTVENRPAPRDLFIAQSTSISPAFFQAIGIPLRRGRGIEERDGANQPLVAVINETFARRQFPNEDPIGKRVKLGTFRSTAPWLTIVGIAGDVRHNAFAREIRPLLYRPLAQEPARSAFMVLKTAGDPMRLGAPARAAVHSIDPVQPVFRAYGYRKVIADHLVALGYVASTMSVAGLLALVLSVVGVYSVMSYSVAERTHEIGVRVALGAAAGAVQWQVVRGGLLLTGVGLAIGLALAVVLARVVSRLIYGVSAYDVTAFGGVSLLLVLSAALACWLPARRASRVDPMVALRSE